MAVEKITKKQKYEMAIAMAEEQGNDMLVEFFTHEIELLDRKSSKTAKETPAQKDSVAVTEIIKDILAECADPNGMTVGAILKDERIKVYKRHNGEPVSSQMVTSIFTKNPKDFVNTKVKKVSYYALAYGEVEEGV